MQKMLRLVAAAAFAFVAGATSAAMDPAKVAAAKKAGDEFIALAAGSDKSGQVPRQADPNVKTLLDTVFDRTALGPTVLPINESGKLGEDQKAMDQAERNIGAFAPEIGRWFDYQMAIQGAVADSTIGFLATAKKNVMDNPQVKAGLADVRGGLTGAMRGVLQMMASDTLDDGWRRDRLVGLGELAPRAAKLLSAEQAASLKDSATQLAAALNDPGLKASLATFAETVARGP